MNYKIVQNDPELGWIVSIVAEENFTAWCEIRGIKITGANRNPRQRKELQGHATCDKLLGPMWDGDCIRYEDRRANDILSA